MKRGLACGVAIASLLCMTVFRSAFSVSDLDPCICEGIVSSSYRKRRKTLSETTIDMPGLARSQAT